MDKAEAPRRSADPFLLVLLALSLAVNVWLGLRVRALQAAGPAPAPPKLQVGDVLPPLPAYGPDGQPVTLSATGDARPTVFYTFSHTCPWCRRNQPAIASLAAQVGTRFRFIGLCMARRADCAPAPGDAAIPTYAEIDAKLAAQHGLGTVPQTVVVSPQGKVERVFRGAYVGANQSDVETYFGVQLPKLEDPKPTS
jgi:hypothetical protein